MVPFVENLLRDGTFRRKFRKALFSETQKCPQKTQKWPLGYFIKSMPLVANANAVAISLERILRLGVGALAFDLLNKLFSNLKQLLLIWTSWLLFWFQNFSKFSGSGAACPLGQSPTNPVYAYMYMKERNNYRFRTK